MADQTISRSQSLVSTSCPTCGVLHAYPVALDTQAVDHPDDRSIYCPNGHGWSYVGETDAQKEKKLRVAAEARAKAIQDQLDSEKRAHTATKGELTKTRKRVAGGVCPCCKRHFVNMERHMASKHPNLADGA